MPNRDWGHMAGNNFGHMQGALREPQQSGGRTFNNDTEEIKYLVEQIFNRQTRMYNAMKHCAVGLAQLANAIRDIAYRQR